MNKSPRYHIIILIFTCPYFEETCAKLWPRDGRQISTFFLLLFDSIGGAVELARSQNKVHAKNRKISFSRIFCSAIYTYSTVYIIVCVCKRLFCQLMALSRPGFSVMQGCVEMRLLINGGPLLISHDLRHTSAHPSLTHCLLQAQ